MYVMQSFSNMTRVGFVPVLIVIFTSCLNGQYSCLQLESNPQAINELIMSDITLTCTPSQNSSQSKSKIVVMEIGKQGHHPMAILRSAQLSFGANMKSNMEASGQIVEANTTQSILQLTIKRPGVENTGVYSCLMFYLNEFGELNEERAFVNVSLDKNDDTVFTHLLNKVSDLEMKLKGMEKNDQTVKAAVTLLQSKMNEQITKMEDQELRLSSQRRLIEEQTDSLHVYSQRIADLEKEIKKEQNRNDEEEAMKSSMIAFSASYNDTDELETGNTVLFRDSIMNIGDAYNTSTGVFTALQDGVYVFNLFALTHFKPGYVNIDLIADGKIVTSLHADDVADQASVSALVSLRAGQEVKPVVSIINTPRVLHPGTFSMFNGYLVKSMSV